VDVALALGFVALALEIVVLVFALRVVALALTPGFLGQLSLASLRGRLIEYQLLLGVEAGVSPLPGGR